MEGADLADSRERGVLGIVFALEIETRGLRSVMSHSQPIHSPMYGQSAWRLGGAKIVIEIAGMGERQARQASNRLIDQGATWVACAGFATALDDMAHVGDVVIADSVASIDSPDSALTCSRSLIAAIPPSGKFGYSVWRSDFVSTDSMILKASKKHEIYAQTHAAALDMESSAVGEVCAQRGIPFVAIKGISDTADQNIPEEIQAFSQVSGWLGLTGLMLKNPQIWPDVWKLRKNSLKASDNLGDILGMMLLRLFA